MIRDHDWLVDCFDALDRVIFLGTVSALGVKVRWARWRKTKRDFLYATYDFDRKLIEVSPVLKWEWIPEAVVLDTLHHECVHAWLGNAEHDAAFKLAERSFIHHLDSELWTERNHAKMLAASPPGKEPAE